MVCSTSVCKKDALIIAVGDWGLPAYLRVLEESKQSSYTDYDLD